MLTYPDDFIYLALVVKNIEFKRTRLEDPIVVLQNFVKFYLFFVFTYFENLMCLT